MKQLSRLAATMGLAIFALSACQSGDSNDNASSKLSMLVQNSVGTAKYAAALGADTLVSFSDGATTFTISEARMHIRDIRFDTASTDVLSQDTHTIAGPYVMNLLDGSALPGDVVFDAPAGLYQRVDIRLDEANEGEGVVAASDELHGNAMIVKGTHDYNGGTNAGTFTLTVKISEDIRFEPSNGIIIDADTGADILLNFRVTDWLENPSIPGAMIDLSSCITAKGLIDGDNHITLNEGTQCDGIGESIGNLVKDNMKNRYDFSL